MGSKDNEDMAGQRAAPSPGDNSIENSKCTYEDLVNKRVAITGAAAGIGKACALAFARQGAKLVLNDLDEEALEEFTKQLRNEGCSVEVAVGSVVNSTTAEHLVATSVECLGGLDILVNNAGISMNCPSLELSEENWSRAIEVNLTGSMLCAQAAARQMKRQGSGSMLNVASMFGVVAAPERLAYCASKSAVIMMTKVLAIEWARFGIRVNALAPGYIETALVSELIDRSRISQSEIIKRTPLAKMGSTADVAGLALFLSSTQSQFITGQVFGVDGGWTAYGYL